MMATESKPESNASRKDGKFTTKTNRAQTSSDPSKHYKKLHEKAVQGEKTLLDVISKALIKTERGAEDSIGEHVKLIVKEIDKYGYLFGVIKIVLQCHHIRRRYFGVWFSMYGVPPVLLEKIQGDSEEVKIFQIENFNKKIATIASYLEEDAEKRVESYLNHETILFPESQLLDFLLKIDCLDTLEDFLKTYQHFPHLVMYEDFCWPPIMEFVPYNLYIEIPEIEKLEIPPYQPIEEIEVKHRMKGYKVEVTHENKTKQKSVTDIRNTAEEGQTGRAQSVSGRFAGI